MLSKKQKNTLFILDIVEAILSVVAIITFTLVFRLDNSDVRYLFLIGDFYVIYSFSKTLSSLETKIEKLFTLKKKQKLERKIMNELSV